MKIVEEKKGLASIFSLSGRLDSTTSIEVENKIETAIAEGSNKIVLDLASLDYVSSSGIRVLIRFHKQLEKQGGSIVLANVTKPIENILYITGFLPYFKIYDSLQRATESVSPPLKEA